MDAEIARKLKDARFPDGKTDRLLVPSLSQLIAACGENFAALHKLLDTNEWQALAWMMDEYPHTVPEGVGQTPEDAVANLWLALNKKINSF